MGKAQSVLCLAMLATACGKGVAGSTGTTPTVPTPPTLSVGDIASPEGDAATTAFTFVVQLDQLPAAGSVVTVDWSTVDGTATAPEDYTAASGSLSFTDQDPLSATITVPVVGDTNIEAAESFSVTLSNAQGATIKSGTATAAIEPDDFPAASIAGVTQAEGTGGFSSFVFTVTLSDAPPPGLDAQVAWGTADGSANTPSDYIFDGGVLTFSAGGALSQTVSIAVAGDANLEPNESFTVHLSAMANVILAAANSADGIIVNDDFPTLSVEANAVTEGDTGTTPLILTVNLSALPFAGQDVSVDFSTVDGSAIAGSDYTATSGSLTFSASGPLSQTVFVQVLGDGVIELDETLGLSFSNASNIEVSPAADVGTILADDFPTLSIDSPSVTEGDSGTQSLTFTVSISPEPLAGQDATVDWTTADGSATAGSDYAAASGSLTFVNGGSLSQTVSVDVYGDTTFELDETFSITLQNDVHAELPATGGTGTILTDDYVGVSVSDAQALEGAGPLVFTVTLDTAPKPGADLTVDWATSGGTATEGVDYTASSGTLTFTSTGSLSQDITVTVTDDAAVEPDETFTLTLSNIANGVLIDASGTGTISADDFPDVSISDVSDVEGQAASAPFAFAITLSASPPVGYPLSVDFATADGTATSGGDYAANNGTLTFSPGASVNQNVLVYVYGDILEEPDETFTVTLSNPQNAGVLSPASATGTIVSDDLPHVSISEASLAEGDAGTADMVFTVTLSSAALTGRDVSLSWSTLDGTAMAPGDYTAAQGGLVFTSSDPLTQTVSVPVQGDTLRERDEIFSVKLTSATNVIVDDPLGIGHILDDETPFLSIDDVTLAEGDSGTTAFVFTVTTTQIPAPGGDITVDWATAPRTATSGTDFVADSGSLTFTSADPDTQTITVLVNGDTQKEAFEELEVRLSNAVNARIRHPRGLGTIVDDDGAIIRVDPTATAATPDGLSWPSAYPTVQAGVDRAQALGGGQVWVARSHYLASSTTPLLTMRSLVTVLGGFDGYQGGAGAQETSFDQRDWQTNVTILDGGGVAYHVVVGASSAVLDGFSITGGNANSTSADAQGGGMTTSGSPTISHCRFFSNNALNDGGAIYTSGAPHIHDCQFSGNTADRGGAIWVSSASPVVEDSIFAANLGLEYGGGIKITSGSGTYNRDIFASNTSQYGAGIESTWSVNTFRDCDFVNGTAYNASWGNGSGAGLYSNWGDDRVYGCSMMNNVANNDGGGLVVRDSGYDKQNGSMPVAERGGHFFDLRIEYNQASSGAGIYTWNTFGNAPAQFVRAYVANNTASTGAGVDNLTSNFVFVDTVIEGNVASSRAGGVYNRGSSPSFINSTLTGNYAPVGPEMYNLANSGDSVPIAISTIVQNRTLVTPAVVNDASCTGCGLSASYSALSDSGDDAGFINVPLFTTRTLSGSTTTVLKVTSADSYFAVGDVIEVADDGVARSVDAVTSTDVTLSPTLAAAPAANVRLDNWGPGATDLTVDLQVGAASMCIDAGSNSAVPADTFDIDGDGDTTEPVPLDYAGNSRFVDDTGVIDTGEGTAPIADIGAYERQ